MRTPTFACLLLCLFASGCGGPYVINEVNVQDGMVVGAEQVSVGSDGQVTGVTQEGDAPNDPYLDNMENGGQDLGPNAPGGEIPVITP